MTQTFKDKDFPISFNNGEYTSDSDSFPTEAKRGDLNGSEGFVIDFDDDEYFEPKQSRKKQKKSKKIDIRDIEDVKMIPCMLPDDKIIETERHDRYEDEGILNEYYECQICRIGDSKLSKYTTRGISKFFELYDIYHKMKSDSILFKKMASVWNEHVYKINLKLDPDNSLNLETLTETKVQYHFRNCSPKDYKSNIWKDIEFITLMQDHLRKNSIFSMENTLDDDDETSSIPKMDVHKLDKWLKLHTTKISAFNFMKNYEKSQMNDTSNLNKRKRL